MKHSSLTLTSCVSGVVDNYFQSIGGKIIKDYTEHSRTMV